MPANKDAAAFVVLSAGVALLRLLLLLFSYNSAQ
jgi:hypothetical protein